ncbi:aminoglycoside phosphotransferase family protein [uncultured Psychrobacter sp.]|uniref:aminoglycoside phosphotransferase family protein n=1 Tax=uncultured Psychrobacter sp. TaxID=259303 RepID=UPI00345A9EAB
MSNNTISQPSLQTKSLSTNLSTKYSRQEQLERWLQQTFVNQTFILNSLPGDASARRYHRIQLFDSSQSPNSNLDQKPSAQYIVMDSQDEKEAMQQFVNVTKLMAPAINVPKLIAQDLSQGFLVLQDFGPVEFAHLLTDATPKQVDDYYQWAMQSLIALQSVALKTAKERHQLPDYDAQTLNREMDLFSEWFVPFIGVSLDKSIWDNLKSALVKAILVQPQVIVHRDYHSRNLMQDQVDMSRLGIIDFQDALIGAYSYDLVSLVRDAYVEWPEHEVSQWIYDFWQMQQQVGLRAADSAEQFENDVNVMGVQRHLKVLGIFIRLFERDGKDRYLADIPKVMRDLLFELDWLEKNSQQSDEQGNKDLQQALTSFNQWLKSKALPAYQHKFAE